MIYIYLHFHFLSTFTFTLWSRFFSLHCNQRLVLLLKFIHTWRALSNQKIPFQALNDSLKNTQKENFQIRKWKLLNWMLFLLSWMLEFLIRPSTRGICRTRQNLPQRTGPRCFNQTFSTKVEAPSSLLHHPRLHLPSYQLPFGSRQPDTRPKPPATIRVRVPPSCEIALQRCQPDLQKTLSMNLVEHLASSSR